MSVAEIISLATLGCAVCGGIFAWFQWRKSNKLKRAEFLDQIIQKLRFDEEFVETIYSIDYETFSYNDKFQTPDNPVQMKVDKLLSYLDYICYLRENRIIKEKEFSPNRYIITRVCCNEDICCYLWNLYHFSHSFQKDCSFEYLIKYCLKKGLFVPEVFKDPSCECFKNRKYLNF